MIKVLIGLVMIVALSATEARAERVSTVVGKAAVAAAKATATAVRPVAKLSWRGVKWVAAHV